MSRKNKIDIIYKARKAGISDNEILKELRLGGITIQKARELMSDSVHSSNTRLTILRR